MSDRNQGQHRFAHTAIAGAALFFTSELSLAQSTPAGARAEGDADLSEVVVTGTRIRGVAPVGSTVVQIDQQDLINLGLTSVADSLNTVPFLLKQGAGNDYSGGTGGQGSTLNGLAFNKSPNLRGFGPQATLSLVNGHRVPYEGANMNAFDGDNLPSQVLKSVEIVADGTSPIYGADAIAGTVNYVTRDPFTGLEAYGKYGTGKGLSDWQGTLVGGFKWDSGGFIASYQHSKADPLRASSRPSLYNDDFTAFGGAGSSLFSSPGNIVVNGVSYGIPKGQDGSTLTLAQLTTPNAQNSWTGYDAVPGYKRDVFTLGFKQRVTDWLELFGDSFYSDRDFDMALLSQGNQVLVTIPNTNFYSPCNRSLVGAPAELVAACATGSLSVQYNTVFDTGPVTRKGYAKSWDGNFGARFTLPADWSATLQASHGKHDEKTDNTYFFGNGLAASPFAPPYPPLSGTTAATAYNVFCDGGAFACNPASLTAPVVGPNWGIRTQFEVRDYSVNADGPVMTLPGGALRIAVGAERFEGGFTNTNNFGVNSPKRVVTSGYVEAYIPLVGDGNAMTGIRKLELDIAGRIDHYDDVGNTRNPKIGINWTPVDGLRLHGSYGTSFRAPGLADNDPTVQHGYLVPSFAGGSIDASLCPTCAGVPGGVIAYQVLGGANGDLKPEESRTYSFGLDWSPEAVKGLDLSVNWWSVSYTNQVNYPVYNAGAFGSINQQIYNNYIIYNPALFPTLAANNPVAFFGSFPVNQSIPSCAAVYGQNVTTQVLFDQLLTCINSGGDGGVFGPPGSPSNVVAIEDGHRLNAGVTKGRGLDLTAVYAWDNAYGSWRIGGNGERILRWRQAPISGAPLLNVVNTYTYPLRFRGRMEFGWNKAVPVGRVGAHLFINHDGSYTIPQAQLPAGVPSRYTHISAYTTADLTLTWDTGEGASPLLRNLQVVASVQNLFDKDPPLLVNAASVGAIRFDNLVTSPLKRVLQVQVGRKW